MTILRVALPLPLHQLFDYQAPDGQYPIGVRVEVPFGRQTKIGYVVETTNKPDVELSQLKTIICVVDDHPVIDPAIWPLIQRSSRYYHYPLGEAIQVAMPNLINRGDEAKLRPQIAWKITELGMQQKEAMPNNAVRLKRALHNLAEHGEEGLTQEQTRLLEITKPTLNKLVEKGFVDCFEISPFQSTHSAPAKTSTNLSLTDEQQNAVNDIEQHFSQFYPALLFGITGSGKTEVYLSLIEKLIEQGRQALVLVPEIGLTPQTLSRFAKRFARIGVLHSGITDRQRLDTWLSAKNGLIDVIIGTRSALFTPLPNLGIVVVDEEHDASLKQQEGFRYSARDLALVRGQIEKVPVILGSATPSLETIKNVALNQFKRFDLTHRHGSAVLPKIRVIDARNEPLQEGLSLPVVNLIEQHLKRDQQVLVFINRRGFAPALLCHQCGWIAECKRCDRYLTLHTTKQSTFLQCHHCGAFQKTMQQCGRCHQESLLPVGQGTERLEQFLEKRFPDYSIQRIDRDTTRRKKAMGEFVAAVKSGETRLLVGTQMLAKGHHFPKVSLVVVLDIDGALFSTDFRAPEKAAQLITQVSGRAGRGETPGEVVIQTHLPEHPLLDLIAANNYERLTTELLNQREQAQLPPFTHMALIRSANHKADMAENFLQELVQAMQPLPSNIELLGPIASTISRKAGKYRFNLLINANNRQALHQLIDVIYAAIPNIKLANRVRWSIDVDPIELL